MTDEEMAKDYAEHNLGKYTNEFGNLYHAFLAGLKAGKDMAETDLATVAYMQGAERYRPKWHDLRKNPNDLPKEEATVIICFQGNNRVLYDLDYFRSSFPLKGLRDVIAWCEIPQYTEE